MRGQEASGTGAGGLENRVPYIATVDQNIIQTKNKMGIKLSCGGSKFIKILIQKWNCHSYKATKT